MENLPESRVVWHADGYIEMSFAGLQTPDALQGHIALAKALAAAQPGPVNLLIDARNGRVGRDARSFSLMLSTGWVKNLHTVIILISEDPQNTEGARRSNIIVSVLTSALRLRPIYATDEAAARALAKPQP